MSTPSPARAFREVLFTVAAAPEAVRTALAAALRAQGHEVTDAPDGTLAFRGGSQLVTRLLGGWFIPPKYLPRRGSVAVRPDVAGAAVQARFEEDLGFGLLDPIFREKYERSFDGWLVELRQRAGPAPGQAGDPAPGPPPPAG